jgi:hypothetical protein
MAAGPALGWGWVLGASLAVLVRPTLWLVAIRQLLRLAPRGWWRRAPFLPVPDAGYLRFRLVTQYGDPNHEPEPADLVSYLRWCRDER